MSDEQNENQEPAVEESPAVVERPNRKKKSAIETLSGGADLRGSGFRLMCSQRVTGTLFDNDRNIRIPPSGHGDVKASGPILAGSWLAAQILAGLVVIVD